MKVFKYHRTAFERQISESVKIQENMKHQMLNTKGEYNRCALPRLGLKMGTREYNQAQEKEKGAKGANSTVGTARRTFEGRKPWLQALRRTFFL